MDLRTPHTTNCIASFRVQKRPTRCSLPAGIGGNEGIRTTRSPLPVFQLALSALIFLLYLVVAFSHLRTCRHAALAISRTILPSSLPSRLTSQHCKLGALANPEAQDSAMPQKLELLLVRRLVCRPLLIASHVLHLPGPIWFLMAKRCHILRKN